MGSCHKDGSPRKPYRCVVEDERAVEADGVSHRTTGTGTGTGTGLGTGTSAGTRGVINCAGEANKA